MSANGQSQLQKLGVALIVICTVLQTGDVLLGKFGHFSSFDQEFHDFQQQVTAQLAALQAAVAPLAGQNVTISTMQEHLHAIDARLDSEDGKIEAIEGQEIKTRADLDNVIRSSAQPLPTRR